MFHLFMFLFSALLFFVLTPGILLTIPSKSSKCVVALVHALVFATVWYFTHKIVWRATEGFYQQNPVTIYKKGQLNLKITSDWETESGNIIKKINSVISQNPDLSIITSRIPCTINKTTQKCNEISKIVLTDYSNNSISELVLNNAMVNDNNNQINDFFKNNGF